MYRILVADDEGIMLEAFKSVIAGAFGEECVVETAKTGRAVTEIAETFHPDVVFMDIHMPGINGIQAMREIRKFNTTALFYVVSAYDKFDYAKEAIDLGVERYLTKPIPRAKIIAAVEEAIGKVDAKRNQRSNLLKIQEKLETVIPVVESSFVGSLLFQQEMQAADYYQQLLDIEDSQGYVMILQFGQSYENGRLVSQVGMNVKAQEFYGEIRDIVKSYFSCAVGSIMSNRIPIVVPCPISANSYEERIDLVESSRSLISKLEGRIEAKFRIGIGRVREMQEMERSYREALRALNGSKSRVIHIEDLSQNGVYDEEFPVEMEKSIFRYLEEGKEESKLESGIGFVYQIIIMSMILYYEKRQDRKDGLIFKITALSFLFVPLGFIAQLIARIGMYLQVSMIATYPLMIRTINNRIVRAGTLFVIMFFTIYDFFSFFNSEIWRDSFIEYHTIFESFIWR